MSMSINSPFINHHHRFLSYILLIASTSNNCYFSFLAQHCLIQEKNFILNMMVDADQTASSVLSNTSASSVNTLQPTSVFKTITITKSEADGFGFNIIGGTDGPYIPGHTGIFFSRIRNSDLESEISEGDRIISVNDKSMEEITHEEAVEILKQLKGECEFKIQTNAERAIAMAMSFDTTPEGSTDMESMSTRPLHASTHTASLHLMPNVNNAHGYPSQLTEIAIVVVGAAALSLIAYVGYNRIKTGTWWK